VANSSDKITIYFNGKPVSAEPGDTVAAALYRSGRRIFARSFKYHRPRGLLCMAGKCPNCLMNVDGAPNIRTCATEVRDGMQVRHQNARPSLETDWLSGVQRFDWLMPVGWYYKTMTRPAMWHAAEPYVRKIAGLGDAPAPDDVGAEYEHTYRQAEVAVIGGGPAGMAAAAEAGEQGKEVILIDDQPALGGHLRYNKKTRADVEQYTARLKKLAGVEVIYPAYCFGLYEGNLLGVLQKNPHPGARERLIHLRARHVVVATGAYEVPLLFENNDLVGVMLSTAAQRLIHLYGILPGKRSVVIGRGPAAQDIAQDLRDAGGTVEAVVEPESVLGASGRSRVERLRTRERNIACDLIVVCGHRVPDSGLIAQGGGRVEWSAERGAFLPVDLPSNISAVGEVLGPAQVPPVFLPERHPSISKRSFICLCSDVSSKDVQDAVAEGFDHIETLKRYTTATMGPCQGRMCQLSSIAVCARETGRGMGETGTTTARPPNPSVSLGALAGARHHPIRRTPMHYQHEELNAVWLDMGDWKRPRYYRTATCAAERECVQEEYRAVRERVGLIDVSTLGKLEVKGRDAGLLLDKVYTNRFSDLKPGRVRYSVICDEAGIMLDDGTISRLSDSRYFITTTTGNLDFVQQWLEWWTVGTGWDVYVTNLTGGIAAVNLAGPKARDVLRKLTDCDLEPKAFPYMACREARVSGIPAILLRIGFVGETGWEIHAPAESGPDLWNALLEAGREFDIRPFAVEAQRLLRLEKRHVIVGVDTDALTNPYEAGMAWIAKLDKDDFVGKAALSRLESHQPQQSLVGFVMSDDSVPEDGAAVLLNGQLAGRVTSARYSPVNGKAVGLAWVPAAAAAEGFEIEVRVGGRPTRATVTQQPFYDPEGARLRM
jgi:sarcosine oxidase subunit alpha